MPYSSEHKRQTRLRIIEAARILFNRHGYQNVTIDMVMDDAGLTRGGFYNHFKNKEDLFNAAVMSFLMGRGAQWREEAGVDVTNLKPEMVQQMLDAYLSNKHLGDIDGQCPMIALPSDIARSSPEVQNSFQELLKAMVWLFESKMDANAETNKRNALSMTALCIGGMVLARTLPDSGLAEDIRSAAHAAATDILNTSI